MTCVLDYVDDEGHVTRRLVLEHLATFANGELRQELVSAREDGRDVTDRERKEREDEARASGRARRQWTLDEALEPAIPFLWEAAPYHLEMQQATNGVARLLYRSARNQRTPSAAGWLELDVSDSLPLRHHFVPEPLPRRIRKLVTVVRYGRLDGIAVPESTESVGEGGFLFIRRRFEVRMTYHDWRLNLDEP
jgi:hypothetical protein